MKGELVITVFLILILACPLVAVTEANKVLLTNQARIAEANAEAQRLRERQSYHDAVAEQARVDQLRAEGEREVLLSAARAVDGNTVIVARLADDYFPEPEPQYSPVVIAFAAGASGSVLGVVLSNLDVTAWLRRKARASRERRMPKDETTVDAARVSDRLPESDF